MQAWVEKTVAQVGARVGVQHKPPYTHTKKARVPRSPPSGSMPKAGRSNENGRRDAHAQLEPETLRLPDSAFARLKDKTDHAKCHKYVFGELVAQAEKFSLLPKLD